MKIKIKLIIAFLLVALIPLVLISNFYISKTKNVMRKSVGVNFEKIAKEKSNLIDSIIKDRISEASLLAEMSEIRNAVKEANNSYVEKSDEEAMKEIREIDGEWIKSKITDENANKILSNKISAFLTKQKNKDENKYGEIFVTDRKGATVGMTKILSDYYQADEQWWIESFNNGKGGKIFIDDRGFDESIKAFAFGVVAPVKENGEVIGVLKINYKIKEILEVVGNQTIEKGYVILGRSQGDILSLSYKNADAKKIKIDEHILKSSQDYGYDYQNNENKETISGYSFIQTKMNTRTPSPGEKKGISGEKWIPTTWVIVMEINSSNALNPLNELVNFVLLISLAVALCVGITAYLIARSIYKPIINLQRGIEIIAKGNFNYKVGTDKKDEIGQLSRAFDEMTKVIRKSYVKIDKKVDSQEENIINEQKKVKQKIWKEME